MTCHKVSCGCTAEPINVESINVETVESEETTASVKTDLEVVDPDNPEEIIAKNKKS